MAVPAFVAVRAGPLPVKETGFVLGGNACPRSGGVVGGCRLIAIAHDFLSSWGAMREAAIIAPRAIAIHVHELARDVGSVPRAFSLEGSSFALGEALARGVG